MTLGSKSVLCCLKQNGWDVGGVVRDVFWRLKSFLIFVLYWCR